MKERNMWIGETGRDQSEKVPDIAKDAVPVVDVQVVPQEIEVNPATETPLAVSELSLDELVPRTWKKW